MTKKDCTELIIKAIRFGRKHNDMEMLAYYFVGALEVTHPRFDPHEFLQACGIEDAPAQQELPPARPTRRIRRG